VLLRRLCLYLVASGSDINKFKMADIVEQNTEILYEERNKT